MKIAFMGTRGIPANYSGFETFVENIALRLVQHGEDVTVYNRTTHIKKRNLSYKGVKIINLPTIPSKHFDTIVHTFLSLLHGIFKRYDVIYFCGVGNVPIAILSRLFTKKVVINIDGSDWHRGKWNGFAKYYLKQCEKYSKYAGDVIIADSNEVKEYLKKSLNIDSEFIPYGGDLAIPSGDECLKNYGIEKNKYILFVGRLVPENNAHMLIEAYKKIKTDIKLVVVGDAPYSEEYKKKLYKLSQNNTNIIFTGYVFGEGYRQLSYNAMIYVLASEVGGTHPVLVEQMFAGNCIIVNNIATNIEVIGDSGMSFDGKVGSEDLKNKFELLLENHTLIIEYKQKAKNRAHEKYSWKTITKNYVQLFNKLLKNN